MKPKAVVVGGSIAGWDVVVVDKTCGPIKGSPTGAGLGVDPLAQRLVQSWLGQPELLHHSTLPPTIDMNQATDSEKRISWTLRRDNNFNFRGAHWADLHGLLHNALLANILLWGHLFLSFCISDDRTSVKIKAKVLQTDEEIEIVCNILVAADGSLSSIRQSFLPGLKLRYSGYCAWRGVFDFSGNENSETIEGIHRAYLELGSVCTST